MTSLKPKSVKLNLILNAIRLFMGMALPVFVFPYVSRILGPSNIGKVDFATSIVNYFVLFAALGIPTYGMREVAKVREDKELLSKTVFELILILVVTNFLLTTLYFLMFFLSPIMKDEKLLYLVIFPSILLNSFCFDWFYIGIEDQIFITIRYAIVKLLQILLIFLFVNESSDYVFYAGVLVGANGIAAVFNILRLRKYISKMNLGSLEIYKHIKPILVIFVSIVAINIYLQLDVTMVGIFVGEKAVGLYTTANRIIRVIISIVTVIGSVMLPRLTNNIKNGQTEEYKKNLSISLNFILLLAIPFMFGTIAISDQFIVFFAGESFFQASFSMKLLSPIILIVGLANFVGLQILYSNKKEWIYTLAVSIAAIINFVTNFIFIPVYHERGAVVGTIIAELTGLLIMSILGRSLLIKSSVLSLKLLGYPICGLLMFICMIFANMYFNSLIFTSLSGIFSYLCFIVIYYKISGVKFCLKNLLKFN